MSVTATRSSDANVRIHCPGCSALLGIKSRANRCWVTCPAARCGRRFVVEARRPAARRPATDFRKVALLTAAAATAFLFVGTSIVVGLVYLLGDRHNRTQRPVVQNPDMALAQALPAGLAPGGGEIPAPVEPARPATAAADPPKPTRPTDATAVPALGPPKKGPRKEPAPSGDSPAGDAIEKVKRSTALIERKDGGSGSGFVIRSGIVMTNFHVIAGSPLDELTVRFVSLNDTSPPSLKPTLLYCNPERDLAVLRVDTDRPALDFCPPNTKLEGLEVAVVGNPTDGVRGQVTVNKVTTGHLAAPVRRDAGWTYYELRAEARPGNSGGPVVDRKTGKVVGVLQSIAVGKGPERSYCIPFGEAARALEQLPADREKERKAIRIAAGRHALDYFKNEMPKIENIARNAMTLQLLLLRAKARGAGATVEVHDKRTGQVFTGAEVMTQLKEEYTRSYERLGKLLEGPVTASPEVPSALASKARTRLETCGKMRSLAGGKTETETAFRHEIDSRTAANDTAARNFDDEYKKYLDGLDPVAKGK